jgi:hypothetical protein
MESLPQCQKHARDLQMSESLLRTLIGKASQSDQEQTPSSGDAQRVRQGKPSVSPYAHS